MLSLAAVGADGALAQTGPSPPAALTNTIEFAEGVPHVSADGRLVAIAGVDATHLSADRYLFHLDRTCGETSLERVTFWDEVSSFPPILRHFSLSADGTKLAYFRSLTAPGICGESFEVRLLDRQTEIDARLDWIPPAPFGTLDTGRGHLLPRAALSADGKRLLYQVVSPFAGPCLNAVYLDDTATPTLDKNFLTAAGSSLRVAITQSPLSADGSRIVLAGEDAVNLYSCPTVSGCTSQPLATRRATGTGAEDATISADGMVAAWVSNEDYCAPSPTALLNKDLWVWREDGLVVTGGVASCLVDAGMPSRGRLYRFTVAGTAAQHETLPVVAGDGTKVFFVSAGNIDQLNDSTRTRLFSVAVGATTWSATLVSDVGKDPLEPPLSDDAVVMASVSSDGRTVVYSLSPDEANPAHYDLRLVRSDLGEETRSDDSAALPAETPFEIALDSCSSGGGQLTATATIRRYRGGLRALTLLFEAEDSSGSVFRAAPRTQRVGNEEKVTIEESFNFEGASGTCRVTVLDGSTAQADLLTDSLGF